MSNPSTRQIMINDQQAPDHIKGATIKQRKRSQEQKSYSLDNIPMEKYVKKLYNRSKAQAHHVNVTRSRPVVDVDVTRLPGAGETDGQHCRDHLIFDMCALFARIVMSVDI